MGISGTTGAGKTTLVREVLLPALQTKLNTLATESKASDRWVVEPTEHENGEESSPLTRSEPVLSGWENLRRVVLVPAGLTVATRRRASSGMIVDFFLSGVRKRWLSMN